MANNVAVTAGSGTTMHTDDVAGVHYPVVKLADGTEDASTRVAAGNGVAAAALRVTIASDSTGVIAVTDNGGSLTADIGAGENHIGEVGGHTLPLRPTVTVSTSPAYTSGDTIGGKITLTNAMRVSSGSGVLQSLLLFDAANQKPVGNIFLFDADLTGTMTDNSAVTWNTADFAKCLGQFPVATADWVTVSSRGIGTVRGINLAVAANGSRNLYAVFVTTSTRSSAATSHLTLAFGFLQD